MKRFSGLILMAMVVAVSAQQGEIYSTLKAGYDYLYAVIRSVCILSGVFLLVGSLYQYSQHKKDPVCVPFSRVLMMLFCAACALGLAFIPNLGLAS